MKRMIYQVAVGAQSQLYLHCIESVSQYCKKYNIKHIVQYEPILKIRPDMAVTGRSKEAVERLGYMPIYEKENAFSHLHEYDQVAIVDSDIYIRSTAPNIFEDLTSEYAFGAVAERELPCGKKYKSKIRKYSKAEVDKSIIRMPNEPESEKAEKSLTSIKKNGDTVGGAITCVVDGMPVGVGEPIFDKLNANLAKAMFSINAVKGFELGSGFNSIEMTGAEHNDEFVNEDGIVRTKTNHSGGIQGGISNGMPINFRVAFKPVATIMTSQNTIDSSKNETSLQVKGRHDPCVVPRAVPIVEALTSLIIADLLLIKKLNKL